MLPREAGCAAFSIPEDATMFVFIAAWSKCHVNEVIVGGPKDACLLNPGSLRGALHGKELYDDVVSPLHLVE